MQLTVEKLGTAKFLARLIIKLWWFNQAGKTASKQYLIHCIHTPPLFKMKLEDYITEDSIFKLLAKLRVRIANKRHSDDFYWRIGKGARNPEKLFDGDINENASICACLPPRRIWHRVKRVERRKLSHDKILELGILSAIYNQKKNGGLRICEWGRNLQDLIDNIIDCINKKNFEFKPPTLKTIPKGHNEVRCLAKYEKLTDRIILSLTARYIRKQFDDLLSPNSYAFRQSGGISYITAIRNLREYRMNHLGEKLYVAECDIQKFFDVINHDQILAAFDTFAQQLDEPIDPMAREVLVAFLKSYSSFKMMEKISSNFSGEKKIDFSISRDLKHSLKQFYSTTNFSSLPLGIPQGGALSPLLVNLVMDCADRAVIEGAPEDIFYARFCDDMIIVHPDKKVCEAAFKRYISKMEVLRLPIHKPIKSIEYGCEFYGEKSIENGRNNRQGKIVKSKKPYLWADVAIGTKNSSPWVSFLGQQIRFDGEVRIRASSVEKHKEKLRKEASRLIRACGKKGQKLRNPDLIGDVLNSFKHRLMALGVGYSTDANRGDINDRCWMATFSGITRCGFTKQQMRELDRERGAVLCKLRHRTFACDGNVISSKYNFFLGRPFSYIGYLERENRPNPLSFGKDMSIYYDL